MRAEVAEVAAGAYARAIEQSAALGEALPLLGVKVLAEIMGFFTPGSINLWISRGENVGWGFLTLTAKPSLPE